MTVNLPTSMLRSFVAIVDAGSMLGAAEHVFVTQSALSLQVKRLEELVQQALFRRDGRRLTLTPSGDVLLEYARRVLALHDEAVTAVTNGRGTAPLRMGMVQDFADTLLAGLLGQFAELHPESEIYARVAGTVELLTMLDRSQLDIILGYAAANDPSAIRVAPMKWYGEERLSELDVLPLAVLEKPCRFREAAVAGLEASGRRYRIAVETPSLSTLRAAVSAGLGITCRTDLFLLDVPTLDNALLPQLPEVAFIVATAAQIDSSIKHLADLAVEVVRGL